MNGTDDLFQCKYKFEEIENRELRIERRIRFAPVVFSLFVSINEEIIRNMNTEKRM